MLRGSVRSQQLCGGWAPRGMLGAPGCLHFQAESSNSQSSLPASCVRAAATVQLEFARRGLLAQLMV